MKLKTQFIALFALTALMGLLYNCASNRRIWDWWNGPAENEAYNRLVQGFESGHLYLRQEAPEGFGFANHQNPYDPQQNGRFLLTDKGSLWDFSYYGSHFYLYYGPVPAVLLMWPYHVVTGGWLSQRLAAVLLFTGMFAIAGALLLCIARRYYPGTHPAVVLALLIGVGLCSGIPVVLSAAGFYEVASAGAALSFMACLLCVWLYLENRNLVWLASASAVFGLAVGCRAEMVIAGPILLTPFFDDRRVKTFGAAFIPAGIIAAGLMIYNYARFDSFTEFGHLYLVSGAPQFHDSGFSASHLAHNLGHYVVGLPRFTASFPFLKDGADVDHENAFGLLTCTPMAALFGLAFLDMRRMLRGFVLGIGASMALLILVISTYQGSSVRYQAEFTPFLFLLVAIGVMIIEPLGSRWFRNLWVIALAASSAFILLITYRLQGEGWKTQAYAALNHDHDVQRAIDCYEKCLAIDDSHHEAHNQYGCLLMALRRPMEAMPHFARALELTPDWPEPRIHYAQALLMTGQKEAACYQLDELARWDTNSEFQVAAWKKKIME